MIEEIAFPLVQAGVLGCVCLFFMWKDVDKDNKMLESLNHNTRVLDKISIILDERIPKN